MEIVRINIWSSDVGFRNILDQGIALEGKTDNEKK